MDDPRFAYMDKGKDAADAILNRFSKGSLRYCGHRFSQDDDITIHADVRDNIRNPAASHGRDRKMNEPLPQDELTSLRSVVGGLAWARRYERPDLVHRANEFQRCCHSKSIVQSLKDANRVVELALQGNDFKITSRPTWLIGKTSRPLPFLTPASRMRLSSRVRKDPIIYIAPRNDVKLGEHKFHLVVFGSSALKRVRRAKLQAEVYIYIYAIQGSVGSGDKLRALLCGLTGNFESVKDPGLV